MAETMKLTHADYAADTNSDHGQDETSTRLYEDAMQGRMKPTASAKLDSTENSSKDLLDRLDRLAIVGEGTNLWRIARNCLIDEAVENSTYEEPTGHQIKAKLREIVALNKDRYPSIAQPGHPIYEGQILKVKPEPTAQELEEKRAKEKAEQCEREPWQEAPAGTALHAEDCQKVKAGNGAKVIAHAGSQVHALYGSFVLAMPNSKIHAFHGSRVANYGGDVEASEGAHVLDMGTIQANSNQ